MGLHVFHHLIPQQLHIGFKHVAVQRARKTRRVHCRKIRQVAFKHVKHEFNHKQRERNAFTGLFKAHQFCKIQ